MNQADQNLIRGIRDILQQEHTGLNELKRTVKSSLRDSMKNLLARWSQCDEMIELNNYEALRGQVAEMAEDQRAWFYIGYTGQDLDSFYLWDTKPKNRDFEQLEEERNPIKSCTYFVRLNGTEEENEHNLIQEFYSPNGRCLNRQNRGKTDTQGFVYVLKYT